MTLTCCVILGKLFNLSESQSPCQLDECNDDNMSGLWTSRRPLTGATLIPLGLTGIWVTQWEEEMPRT